MGAEGPDEVLAGAMGATGPVDDDSSSDTTITSGLTVGCVALGMSFQYVYWGFAWPRKRGRTTWGLGGCTTVRFRGRCEGGG